MDLKIELEKHGLEIVGMKEILMERLEKVLKDNRHNSEEFLIECDMDETWCVIIQEENVAMKDVFELVLNKMEMTQERTNREENVWRV